MKNRYSVLTAIIAMFAIVSLQFMPINSAGRPNPKGEKGKPMPENINSIVKNSCIGCHSEKGNHMAASMVNFDKWIEYNSKKQFRKAKKMCKLVSHGAMPPKKIRKEKPQTVPTDAQVKELCDWAHSLTK